MASAYVKDENGSHETMGVSRKIQLVEVAVFLFLIVPSLVLSLFVSPKATLGFALTAVMVIVRDLALVSLVLFFVWRNGEALVWIGWTFRGFPLEVSLGCLLFVPMAYAIGWVQRFFTHIGLSSPPASSSSFLHPSGGAELWFAAVLVVVVAVAEETIFRGYLMRRFIGTGLGKTVVVLLSSLIFAIGHGYEGSLGVATVVAMGVVFALVYLWRGSLVASMVMHFLQDFSRSSSANPDRQIDGEAVSGHAGGSRWPALSGLAPRICRRLLWTTLERSGRAIHLHYPT
jgi:membrane protease YdiL (CAAX protease family)